MSVHIDNGSLIKARGISICLVEKAGRFFGILVIVEKITSNLASFKSNVKTVNKGQLKGLLSTKWHI